MCVNVVGSTEYSVDNQIWYPHNGAELLQPGNMLQCVDNSLAGSHACDSDPLAV